MTDNQNSPLRTSEKVVHENDLVGLAMKNRLSSWKIGVLNLTYWKKSSDMIYVKRVQKVSRNVKLG